MAVSIIADSEAYEMPELLGPNGALQLLPSMAYDQIDPIALRIWCHRNYRYGLPTTELIQWLKNLIAGRSAIEIGAGAGDLCYHLGIPGTDSKVQEEPWMIDYYKLCGQTPVRYPSWVRRIDALEAVRAFQPQVVVASWVSQISAHDRDMNGFIRGVDEGALLDTGVTYVFIGNRNVHQAKRILSRKHEEHEPYFLKSRAALPDLNVVYVWRGTR